MIALDSSLVADARSLGMTRQEALWLSEHAWKRSLREIDPKTGLHTVTGQHDVSRSEFWEAMASHLQADD